MNYRLLGLTGVSVSGFALGTMTFGDEVSPEESEAILDHYVNAGGNLIDTADVYAGGESERIIGRWLARRHDRDELVLATKARFRTGPGVNDVGLSRAHLHRAVDASLARLQVDYIDLFQCHAWDPLTPVEETFGALAHLVASGKIRAVGVSNVTGWQLERTRMVAAAAGLRLATLQPQWNLLAREVEWELIPLCEDASIGVLPWSPLGGGWLTGKYRRGHRPPDNTRLGDDPERGVEAWNKRATERTWRVLDAVDAVAGRHGTSPAEVALNWLRAQPSVSSVILGVRSLAQLKQNLAATSWDLAAEDLAELDAASSPATPEYPYGWFAELDEERRQEADTSTRDGA